MSSRQPHEWCRDDTFHYPDALWVIENVTVSADTKRVTVEFVASDAPTESPEIAAEPTVDKLESRVPDDWKV